MITWTRRVTSMELLKRLVRVAGRALHHLVHPDHQRERARLDDIASIVRKHAQAQRTQVERQHDQLAELSQQVLKQPTRRDLQELRRDLGHLRVAVRSQHRLTAKVFQRVERLEEHQVLEQRVLDRIARLARSDRSILVGPWSGEVGFELLYWIPFLHWIKTKHSLDPDRLLIVSRGGAASWYRHISTRYLDILSLVTVDELRAGLSADSRKQRNIRGFDRRLIRQVRQAEGLKRVDLLHPALMYDLFYPFWKDQVTAQRIEAYTSHQALEAIAAPQVPLPEEYVAVKFYFSDCFPDTPANRAFIAAILETLTATTHVVVLSTPFRLDEHRDYAFRGDRVHSVERWMEPQRNLELQSAIISRAKAFVGTYGGFSYLAPLYGTRSLTFYSDATFFTQHLELAQRVFRSLKAGSFVALDVRDVELAKLALTGRPAGWPELAGKSAMTPGL